MLGAENEIINQTDVQETERGNEETEKGENVVSEGIQELPIIDNEKDNVEENESIQLQTDYKRKKNVKEREESSVITREVEITITGIIKNILEAENIKIKLNKDNKIDTVEVYPE